MRHACWHADDRARGCLHRDTADHQAELTFLHQYERIERSRMLAQALPRVEGKQSHIASARLGKDTARDALRGRSN